MDISLQIVFPVAVAAVVLVAMGCRSNPGRGGSTGGRVTYDLPQARAAEEMTVRSDAFASGQPIPDRYADYGGKTSPPLSWSGAPAGTASIAVLVEDPDAPGPNTPYVHWVLYNLPPQHTGLPEGVANRPRLDELGGALQGKNDHGTVGYFGPRPPPGHGTHHYHFQVFALDRALDLQPGATRQQLRDAVDGHVLGKGRLVGTYVRDK
jgi:Raf kinase inhibitor-like YbhB/YbcL family protein